MVGFKKIEMKTNATSRPLFNMEPTSKAKFIKKLYANNKTILKLDIAD